MKNRFIFTCLILLVSLQITYSQSPWTNKKNETYLQIGATSLQYSKLKVDSKTVDLPVSISDITTQIYSQYGITDKLEAQLVIPFKTIGSSPNMAGSKLNLAGLGNVTIGLKYKLSDQNWKVSAGLQYAANSILKDASKGLSTGFNANTFLPYVAIGSSISKWYYFGNLGYGYMDNQYSDFLKIGAEIGYHVSEKGLAIVVLDNKIIVRNEEAFNSDIYAWPSYLDRQSYGAIGLKFNYEFKKDKFGANFAAIGAYALNNAPAAPTLNIGVYAKL